MYRHVVILKNKVLKKKMQKCKRNWTEGSESSNVLPCTAEKSERSDVLKCTAKKSGSWIKNGKTLNCIMVLGIVVVLVLAVVAVEVVVAEVEVLLVVVAEVEVRVIAEVILVLAAQTICLIKKV